MTQIDTNKLRALDEHGICACPFCDKPLTYSSGAMNKVGRCLTEGCWLCDRKMTVPLSDPYQVDQFNNRTAILAMAEENRRLREALDWALNEIRCTTRYDSEDQFWNAYDTARRALAAQGEGE